MENTEDIIIKNKTKIMKKKKLVLLFHKDSEINGFEMSYIFDNQLEAESLFMPYNCFKEIRFYDNHFTFKLTSWNGGGKIIWVSIIKNIFIRMMNRTKLNPAEVHMRWEFL